LPGGTIFEDNVAIAISGYEVPAVLDESGTWGSENHLVDNFDGCGPGLIGFSGNQAFHRAPQSRIRDLLLGFGLLHEGLEMLPAL